MLSTFPIVRRKFCFKCLILRCNLPNPLMLLQEKQIVTKLLLCRHYEFFNKKKIKRFGGES